MLRFVAVFYLLSMMINITFAGDIELTQPIKTGGMPLMEVLAKRQTGRRFVDKDLELPKLSDLLWAAWGINREDGKRTAPSALDNQEISVYVVMKSGVYRYDAKANKLIQINEGDYRDKVGMQGYVKNAPLSLVYVAEYKGMRGKEEHRKDNSQYDTGYISQNVYLFCASEGLSTVVIGSVKKEDLRPVLKLTDTQHITLAQPVGYASK